MAAASKYKLISGKQITFRDPESRRAITIFQGKENDYDVELAINNGKGHCFEKLDTDKKKESNPSATQLKDGLSISSEAPKEERLSKKQRKELAKSLTTGNQSNDSQQLTESQSPPQ